MFDTVSYMLAYCALFAVVPSAPINRFNRVLPDEMESVPNEYFYTKPPMGLGVLTIHTEPLPNENFFTNSSENPGMLSAKVDSKPNEDMYGLPSEVLGDRFTRSTMKNLCEVHVHYKPGSRDVSQARHTKLGTRVCVDVCDQYRETAADEPSVMVDVTLLHGNCEFDGQPDSVLLLDSSCTCSYELRSDQKIRFAQYAFKADRQGYVKVSAVADRGFVA